MRLPSLVQGPSIITAIMVGATVAAMAAQMARTTESAELMTAFRKETQCSPSVATGLAFRLLQRFAALASDVAAALVALLIPSTALKEVNRPLREATVASS
jgi:gas vesicle protein